MCTLQIEISDYKYIETGVKAIRTSYTTKGKCGIIVVYHGHFGI